jgi:predicted TIM-barrel fold metal-dependent hydrolase
MQQSKDANMAYADVREDWLGKLREEILDPHRVIVDAHHHLWDRDRSRYLLEEFLTDARSGHAITASVYVECRSMYRLDGPKECRSLGEVEFANGVAEQCETESVGKIRVCGAIVGRTDLRALRNQAEEILRAFVAVGGGRLRGIRQSSNWTDNSEVSPEIPDRPRGLLLSDEFRHGFSWLNKLQLAFDAFLFHPQMAELIDLAQEYPDTKIILNHLGGPIGISRGGRIDKQVFSEWRTQLRSAAKCPNIFVKVGGLGMKYSGFSFHSKKSPPNSCQLRDAWHPLIETAVDAFGTKRSMFESNFPPDKGAYSYNVLWNAFKRITSAYSEDEKDDLFSRTAAAAYRL